MGHLGHPSTLGIVCKWVLAGRGEGFARGSLFRIRRTGSKPAQAGMSDEDGDAVDDYGAADDVMDDVDDVVREPWLLLGRTQSLSLGRMAMTFVAAAAAATSAEC